MSSHNSNKRGYLQKWGEMNEKRCTSGMADPASSGSGLSAPAGVAGAVPRGDEQAPRDQGRFPRERSGGPAPDL